MGPKMVVSLLLLGLAPRTAALTQRDYASVREDVVQRKRTTSWRDGTWVFFKMTLAIFWRYGCVCVCFPKLRDPPKETSVSHWMHHILRFLKGHLGRHTHLAVVYLPHQRIVRIERLGPRPDTKNGKQKDILVMGIMMVVLRFVTCMCCRGRHYTHSIVSHLLICIITHIIN